MIGQITATYDLGCFVGAIAYMALGDYFGRCLSIALGCFILAVGAILQAASYHSAQMIVGRFVAGVGKGINTTAIPVWQSEMSKPNHRGRLIVLQLALNQLGNVTAQWLNFGLGFIDHSSVSWRFPLAFHIFYALLAASATPWLPDSPRWLIQRNREPEARVILARIYNKTSTPDDPEIKALHQASVQSVHHELDFMEQWGGINAINYYLPVVFASLNVSRTLSLILSCCNSINLILSTCIGAIFIDSIGRKNLMLFGALFQGICFAFVGGALGAHTDEWSKVAIAFVFMFFTVFGLTWIAVPWMYPAEKIAWRYYLIYAAWNIPFIPIIWAFYVETAGLSLEEVDDVFEKMGSSTRIDSGRGLPSGVGIVNGQVEKDDAVSEWVEGGRA
ncbi:hypothetical protein BDW59DRAFT_169427 [Aspergillus cavernicola]|uniref:Major facilitator superfamily (MFS) profile domain-containing protein n=1 Tax=Aspergillus cavernicola TaxID=176166 RepID=A0ABR4IXV7_9EURO